MELIATEYETTVDGWKFVITKTNKGWVIRYHPANQVSIPPNTKIRTNVGWEPVITRKWDIAYYNSVGSASFIIGDSMKDIGLAIPGSELN